MKRILVALILLTSVLTIHAQERRVQNRPYTDLRDFHFGVLVGTHLQDLELNNGSLVHICKTLNLTMLDHRWSTLMMATE